MTSQIYTTEELNGLTGDKGERYCVFFRDPKHVLNSAWMWVETEDVARHVAAGNILVALYGEQVARPY